MALSACVGNASGKDRVETIATDGQGVGAEKRGACAFDGADRQSLFVLAADVKTSVAENFDPRRSALRIVREENQTALAFVSPAVGNQCYIAGRSRFKKPYSPPSAREGCAAINNHGGVFGARIVAKVRRAAEAAADCCAVDNEASIARV